MADLQNNIDNCPEAILSEEYIDFIIEYSGTIEDIRKEYNNPDCIQIITNRYAVIHRRIRNIFEVPISDYPICLSPMLSPTSDKVTVQDTSALEDAGISPLFNQPFLQLRGTGVLIAIIDSGIDYTHPAFIYDDNTSKIVSIWDQTIQGNPPKDLLFGSEYTSADINAALASNDPLTIVPSVDQLGHGTFMAGVAAGRPVSANFSGAAPDSELIIVKLKPAKNIFREMFLVKDDVTLYQSNDIMLALKYVGDKALELGRSVAICIPLGTNQGGHDGRSFLEEYINLISTVNWATVITPVGNETTLARHATMSFSDTVSTVNINLRVGTDEKGFLLYIWGRAPDVFSVGVITPSGESVQPITARIGESQTISFILEPTTITVEYRLLEDRSGDPLAILRFSSPSAGIWTITLRKDSGVNQLINLWLPCCNWVSDDTFFLEPNADTTVLVPGSANFLITVGGYNHKTKGVYINSSRGNNRYDVQQPDFLAPAVNVYGPLPNNQYGNLSGTSVAAAITAGSAALIYQWGRSRPELRINALKIRNFIIKGATRKSQTVYPNKESGYGQLNLLNSFNMLRSFI